MVRDVFTAHTPLVGAYSRGFNHPGPTFFYLLAPLSVLAGGATWALSVGAALIQGFGAFALVWLSLRRAGPWFAALMASALGLGYVAFDFGGQFRDAWNPFGAYPWFLVFLVLAWGFAIGNRYDVVGLAATGTFVVQCHIGYLPLVATVVVWALVVGVWSDRRSAKERDDDSVQPTAARPSWRRVSLLTAGVLVVLWAAPVVEQLRHGADGNLAQTWRYFREGGDRTRDAARRGPVRSRVQVVAAVAGWRAGRGVRHRQRRARQPLVAARPGGAPRRRVVRRTPQRPARRPPTRGTRRGGERCDDRRAVPHHRGPVPLPLLLADCGRRLRRGCEHLGRRSCAAGTGSGTHRTSGAPPREPWRSSSPSRASRRSPTW